MEEKKKKYDNLDRIEEKNMEKKRLNYHYIPMHNDPTTFTPFYDILASYDEFSIYDKLVYCTIRNYAKSTKFKGLTTNITNQALATRMDISVRKVQESIAVLQYYGVIQLHKNPKKHERLITIIRDFRVKQPEQIEFEQNHPEYFIDNTEDEFDCNF